MMHGERKPGSRDQRNKSQFLREQSEISDLVLWEPVEMS